MRRVSSGEMRQHHRRVSRLRVGEPERQPVERRVAPVPRDEVVVERRVEARLAREVRMSPRAVAALAAPQDLAVGRREARRGRRRRGDRERRDAWTSLRRPEHVPPRDSVTPDSREVGKCAPPSGVLARARARHRSTVAPCGAESQWPSCACWRWRPAVAAGSTASISIKRVFYAAAPGEVNQLTVSASGADFSLSDPGRADPARHRVHRRPGSVICAGAGITASRCSAATAETASRTPRRFRRRSPAATARTR